MCQFEIEYEDEDYSDCGLIAIATSPFPLVKTHFDL